MGGTAGMMQIDSADDAWRTAFHVVLLATTRSVQARCRTAPPPRARS
ncbi:MAG TPA: hypothetical protein VKA66_06250 [Mycobacterium sp.]|nr:hypothetical protein [Mycobacterium sp.]